MERISIIICSYNYNELLSRCLNSMDSDFDYCDIIIIDDCSKINQKNSFFKNNEGMGAVRNIGIELSKTKWVTFVDAMAFL